MVLWAILITMANCVMGCTFHAEEAARLFSNKEEASVYIVVQEATGTRVFNNE